MTKHTWSTIYAKWASSGHDSDVAAAKANAWQKRQDSGKPKVWVVSGGWEYEGEQAIGVFRTKKRAEKYAATITKKRTGFDSVEVKQFILDEGTA
jgi:hypothetical protein